MNAHLCEMCLGHGRERVAAEETNAWGIPLCRRCYMASLEAELSELILKWEDVEWESIPEIDVAEAAQWIQRLERGQAVLRSRMDTLEGDA